MSGELVARLKAGRPDVDWDAELAAARERRELASAGMTAFASAMSEFAAALCCAIQPVLAWAARMMHDVHRVFFPSRHRRCWACHPSRKPKPLAAGGHEYQRRLRSRRRRKRR